MSTTPIPLTSALDALSKKRVHRDPCSGPSYGLISSQLSNVMMSSSGNSNFMDWRRSPFEGKATVRRTLGVVCAIRVSFSDILSVHVIGVLRLILFKVIHSCMLI